MIPRCLTPPVLPSSPTGGPLCKFCNLPTSQAELAAYRGRCEACAIKPWGLGKVLKVGMERTNSAWSQDFPGQGGIRRRRFKHE